MKHELFKNLFRGMMTAAITFTFAVGLGIPQKVEASVPGQWVLVDHSYKITQASGLESPANNVMNYDYNETNNLVTHEREYTLTNIDGTFHCTFTATCSLPPATIKGGTEMRLKVDSYASGNTLDNLSFPNFAKVRIKDSTLWFRDINDYDHYWIKSVTGPWAVLHDSATVAYKMDEGNEYGEKLVIDFEQSGGNVDCGYINTYWTYEWRSTDVEKPVKAKISKTTKNVNRKTITATVKKISSNCKGYQFQLSTSKAFKKSKTKTIKNTSETKTKATFKKLKKGRKYYIRVRGYNKANGKTVYGKWSGTKTVTLK